MKAATECGLWNMDNWHSRPVCHPAALTLGELRNRRERGSYRIYLQSAATGEFSSKHRRQTGETPSVLLLFPPPRPNPTSHWEAMPPLPLPQATEGELGSRAQQGVLLSSFPSFLPIFSFFLTLSLG